MTAPSAPARPTAIDRLRSLYRSPGPYVSMYLPCGEDADSHPFSFFSRARADLAEQGASEPALDALAARLRLPIPEDCAGWGLFAAADGSTAVDFNPEGPRDPVAIVEALPMAAPLLEWDQWRVPHVAVSFGERAGEVVSFVPGVEPTLSPVSIDPITAAASLRDMAAVDRLRLIVVIDEGGDASGLVNRLRGVVPPDTNVVLLEAETPSGLDEIVDTTVRYAADVVARDTVRALEDFRFMASSDQAAEGSVAAFRTLASGTAHTLLVHDDPAEAARASFGDKPTDVDSSFGAHPNVARRADVAIWSAIQQGVRIRVIPSTSGNGPDQNIGVTFANGADELSGVT